MNSPRLNCSSKSGLSFARSCWRLLRWPLAAASVPLALWACTGHPLEKAEPAPEQQTDLTYEANPIRKLDLVFVVDNSSSMEQEQDNLRANFPDFMRELTNIQGGAPDMHIGIISSNVGAGNSKVNDNCPVGGDRGRFLLRQGCNIAPAGGQFLTVDGTGQSNFPGGIDGLPNVFACLAQLGITGCGYEHQLLSLYFALNGTNKENEGFLRDDAYLGIVILSDEDDCSGEPESADFYAGEVVGQEGSLRCSLRGHECSGQPVPPMEFTSPLADCKPYVRTAAEKASRLIEVPFFVNFIKGLKNGRSDKILVSSVIGWDPSPTAQYKIVKNAAGRLDTGAICQTATTGIAAPGIRLNAFTKSFENNTVATICQTDLKAAMTEIGKKLANIIQNTCINNPLVDTDVATAGVQGDCQVLDRVPVNGATNQFKDQPIKPCDASANMPCWELLADNACMSGFRTSVKRTTDAVPGTLQSIRCLTCPTGSTDPRCVTRP